MKQRNGWQPPPRPQLDHYCYEHTDKLSVPSSGWLSTDHLAGPEPEILRSSGAFLSSYLFVIQTGELRLSCVASVVSTAPGPHRLFARHPCGWVPVPEPPGTANNRDKCLSLCLSWRGLACRDDVAAELRYNREKIRWVESLSRSATIATGRGHHLILDAVLSDILADGSRKARGALVRSHFRGGARPRKLVPADWLQPLDRPEMLAQRQSHHV